MFKQLSLGVMMAYGKKIKALAKRFGLKAWPILHQAETRSSWR